MNVPNSPLTCIDLWCKAGSSFENPGEEGLAHFLEHMVFKGSKSLKEGEFDKKIEALGGSSNAATGLDDVHFYVLVPGNDVKTAIDLLLNLSLTPSFEKRPYLIEKEVVLEEIAQHIDQPEEKIFQYLLQNCWSNHPYGKPILGLEETLKSSSPMMMKEFHERQYLAQNLSLGIAGEIPDNLESYIYKSDLTRTKTYKSQNVSSPIIPKLNFCSGRKEIEVSRLESGRIHMAWALPPARNQRMIIGAEITTSILAEGRNSRLVKHLREDLQIVESIDMEIITLEQGGLFLLEATCLEKNLTSVENEITNVILNLISEMPSKKELDKAKQLVSSSLIFGIELPSQITAIAASQALWDRHQQLLDPLKHINYWNSSNIKDQIFAQLQPEKSFTLIARPK